MIWKIKVKTVGNNWCFGVEEKEYHIMQNDKSFGYFEKESDAKKFADYLNSK